jgi:hypothetical protein
MKRTNDASMPNPTIRAQPFPAPPRELPGKRVDLTVPIRFNLR